jgi:hypothetical protein
MEDWFIVFKEFSLAVMKNWLASAYPPRMG